MKKAIKYFISGVVLLLAFSSLVACDESRAQSSFSAKILQAPTNVDFEMHLSENNETSYHLTWTPVQHAAGYTLCVNDMPIEQTIDFYIGEYDITPYVQLNKANTVSVTALGDGEDYQNSETVSLQCVAEIPTIGLNYQSVFDRCVASPGETEINGKLVIPDKYNGKKVTDIGEHAFSMCRTLTGIVIPDSVTNIGDMAFLGCKGVESLILSKNMTSVGLGVFCGLDNLSSLDIPNSITTIGESAFGGCESLTSLVIPNGVTSIGVGAFERCTSLTSIYLPNSVTSIGKTAFHGCNATDIEIPESVTSIGAGAFRACDSLTDIKVAKDNASFFTIDGNLYHRERISLTEEKITLMQYAKGKTATEFIIPQGVTHIGGDAFYQCTQLTSIEIPDSVIAIGYEAFYECKGLTSIKLPNNLYTISGGAFSFCNNLSGALIIPNNVKRIEQAAFYECSNLTSVILGDSMQAIFAGAFNVCQSMTSIVIPSSLIFIQDLTFDACDSLERVYYKGTAEQWDKINIDDDLGRNADLKEATRYYYSENEPALTEDGTAYDGNFWHYDENGEIVVWVKQSQS